MPKRKHTPPTEDCPHCGERFRAGAAACPHCGSDARTGWADPDEIAYQSVEIPDYLHEDYEDPRGAAAIPWRNALLAAGALLAGLALLRLLLY